MNTVTRSKWEEISRLNRAELVAEWVKRPQGLSKENRLEETCEGRCTEQLGKFSLRINFVAKRGKIRQSTRMPNLALNFYEIKRIVELTHPSIPVSTIIRPFRHDCIHDQDWRGRPK